MSIKFVAAAATWHRSWRRTRLILRLVAKRLSFSTLLAKSWIRYKSATLNVQERRSIQLLRTNQHATAELKML